MLDYGNPQVSLYLTVAERSQAPIILPEFFL